MVLAHRLVRRLVIVAIALASLVVALAGPATASYGFANQQVADRARAYALGAYGGQCKVWAAKVVNEVLAANGIGARVGGYGTPGGAYYGAYERAGGALVPLESVAVGDLIQTINPAQKNNDYPTTTGLHTAIVVAVHGFDNVTVRDSNWVAYEKIGEHAWTPRAWARSKGAEAYVWRFGAVGSPPPPPPAWGSGGTSLIKGGGFETGGWSTMASTNFVSYSSGQIEGENARSGARYGATNTSVAGGGIYQDRPVPIAPGDTFCASAFLRSQKDGTASGAFALWLIGETDAENGQMAYSDLGTLSNWRPVTTCVTATRNHSAIRVQLYPTPNGGTTNIDDVAVNRSMAQGGGFEAGGWAVMPSSNFTTYGTTARSGARYGATNASAAGGGFYQDRPVSIGAGDTYCASAFVRSQAGGTASGAMALWLIGQTDAENGTASYAGIGNSAWRPLTTCVTATRPHSAVRIQFYPTPGGGTTDVDDVNVARSLAQGGGFETGSWSAMASTGYAIYGSGQPAASDRPRSGAKYGATNTSIAGGGIYQDRGGLQIAAGDTYCASAFVKSQSGGTASGAFALWLIGETDAENGQAAYSNIGTTYWHPLSTCVTATRNHSAVRLQFYPTPNGGTTQIDDVSLTLSAPAQALGQVLVPTARPTITGTARVGVKLTASTGTWRPGATSYTYQWLRSGTPIAGATASSYTPVAADHGKPLAVRVVSSRYGFRNGVATSTATANVAAGIITNTSAPTMSGTFRVGYTLTRGNGSWTPGGLTFSYRWRRDGVAITGATGSTYRLVSADRGHNISLAVTAKRTGYTTKTAYAPAKKIG